MTMLIHRFKPPDVWEAGVNDSQKEGEILLSLAVMLPNYIALLYILGLFQQLDLKCCPGI